MHHNSALELEATGARAVIHLLWEFYSKPIQRTQRSFYREAGMPLEKPHFLLPTEHSKPGISQRPRNALPVLRVFGS